MTETVLAPARSVPVLRPWQRTLVAGGAVLVAVQVVCSRIAWFDAFPTTFDTWISAPFDSLYDWVLDNQFTNPVFTRFFTPISNSIEWMLGGLTDQLLALPWFGVAVIAFVIVARSGKWRMAIVAAGAAIVPGVAGLWEPTVDTLALMLVSVGIAVVAGVPLGVVAALDRRFEQAMRPVLDAMQTIPSPAYLVPAVMIFTTGKVPAVVATVIYALPPVVRLTTIGIRGVPADTLEAGTMFGSSRRQLLFKVQLPQAVPSIATGVNQTINMALSIVIIAAFIGAGGLGQEALEMLRQRRTGRGLVVGLCVICVAILLDRISRSFIETRKPGTETSSERRLWWMIAIAGATALMIGRFAQWTGFPHDFGVKWADPNDTGVRWVRDEFRAQAGWLNDNFIREVYVRLRHWFVQVVVWPVWVLGAAMLALAVRGWRLAAFCGTSVAVMGLIGLWVASSETFVQVMISVVIATAIAVPLGVWTGLHPRVESALSPVLDAFQTVPSVTYIIPFVMIFDIGVVPGIIATVIYALAPGIRVSALGVKQVPGATVEAATTFGASNRQLMWGVRVPLALPTIMVAVNQVILMCIAMVIIAGLNGAGGLGYKMVEAFQRQLVGQGIEVALALTLMAMVLDRLTQALADQFRPPTALG